MSRKADKDLHIFLRISSSPKMHMVERKPYFLAFAAIYSSPAYVQPLHCAVPMVTKRHMLRRIRMWEWMKGKALGQDILEQEKEKRSEKLAWCIQHFMKATPTQLVMWISTPNWFLCNISEVTFSPSYHPLQKLDEKKKIEFPPQPHSAIHVYNHKCLVFLNRLKSSPDWIAPSQHCWQNTYLALSSLEFCCPWPALQQLEMCMRWGRGSVN